MSSSADGQYAPGWDASQLSELILDAADKSNLSSTEDSKGCLQPNSDVKCWLNWLVQNRLANAHGRTRIQTLIDEGVTLRASWGKPWLDSVFGCRLYVSHVANFDSPNRLASVVSSRLGRGYRNASDWPRLLDSALAHFARLNYRMLLVDGTAASQILFTAVTASRFPALRCELPKQAFGPGQQLVDWLATILRQVDSENLRERLLVSPALVTESASRKQQNKPPLRDIASVLIPDSVLCLHLRSDGNLQRLLHERLQLARQVEHSAEGHVTTYVAIDGEQNSAAKQLIESGATGWYHSKQQPKFHSSLKRCRRTQAGQSAALDARAILQTDDSETGDTATRFLVHCTRAITGPGPGESAEAHRRRLWHSGVTAEHPLQTLAQIATTGVLRSSETLFRQAGSQHGTAAVCFSAVSLANLLRRRKYQAHLGRWDWEPYGVLVSRTALQSIGAQPVIYGDESTWAELSSDQQPFFQAEGKSKTWRSEQEWRVLSDVRLDSLPANKVCLFVLSQQQAHALSRTTRWPVLWVDGLLTKQGR
ncbi:MAG TPA: hypothetical protein DDW52_03380 [Planctomycetaceae bacterium]|nr:hypothetical protein [Planctomycetaceae bacterium]